MSKTDQNLRDAFAGESQAFQKYLRFAERAADEGLDAIYKLFHAIAQSEGIHARKHLNYLEPHKGTKENLQDALQGEVEEFSKMYPRMMKEAGEESQNGSEISFKYANESERVHAELLKQAMLQMDKFPVQDYYLCQGCGYLAVAAPPAKCPVCGANQKGFFKALSPKESGLVGGLL